MLQPKYIQLPKTTYFDIIWLPTIILISSIFSICVAYTSTTFLNLLLIKFILFVVLFFSMFWLGRIVYQLRYKTYKISVSQQQLFEVIDVLVTYEDWNYGDIKDNIIILHTDDWDEPTYVIYIQYFDDKLLIANTIGKPTESNFFIESYALEEVKKLLFLINEKQRNKNLISLMSKIQTQNYQPVKLNEIVTLFFSRTLSYSFSIGFVAICYLILKEAIINLSIFDLMIGIVISFFVLPLVYIHFKDDYKSYREWRIDKNNKWYK